MPALLPGAISSVMAYPANLQFSPYRMFDREEWARLRADTPMTLLESELEQLSGIIEELSVAEVEEIYLPMSRLLNLYVAASQQLHAVTSKFLSRDDGKVPFILGVAGSVAVGKSTTARVLKEDHKCAVIRAPSGTPFWPFCFMPGGWRLQTTS